VRMVYVCQACEIVTHSVERFHVHMTTVRDYLEQQLQVAKICRFFTSCMMLCHNCGTICSEESNLCKFFKALICSHGE